MCIRDRVPPLEEDMNLVAYVNSPTDVTESYVENLSVEPTSKTTTIAAISLQKMCIRDSIIIIQLLQIIREPFVFYCKKTKERGLTDTLS